MPPDPPIPLPHPDDIRTAIDVADEQARLLRRLLRLVVRLRNPQCGRVKAPDGGSVDAKEPSGTK